MSFRPAAVAVALVAVLSSPLRADAQGASPAPRKPRVAILDVRALGIAPEKAQALSEVALTEASSIAALDVIGRSDIQSMIGFEKEKQMLGCADDSSCMTEIAGAMGVDWILVGSLGQFDALYRLDLKLIDAKRSKIAGRVGESVEGSQSRLVAAVQAGVHRLLDPLAAAVAAASADPAGRPPAPAAKPPPAPTAAAPAGAAPPPPADAPAPRPWAVELRAGYVRLGGGNTEPAALDPSRTTELAVGGGWRLSRQWSLVARFDVYLPEERSISTPYGPNTLELSGVRLGAGAAWHPAGSRWFSVAADLGVARLDAKAEMPYVPTVNQARTGASFGLELRADLPLGDRWFVGARAGSRAALVGFKVEARNPSSSIRMENDVTFLAFDVAGGARF